VPSDVLSLTVKDFLVPGSTMFILVGVAIGVAMLYARPPLAAWGRRWLVTLAVMYLVLSLPLTSDALFAGLNRGYRPLQPEAANGASTIVILSEGIQVRRSGGMSLDTLNLPTAFCALEAARLYHLLDHPLVLASGGGVYDTVYMRESAVLKATLVDLGIPEDRIEEENTSRNTREQATNVVALLRRRNIDRFILVTSPEHMMRAMALFDRAGLHPTPSISWLRYGGTYPILWPTKYALQGSEAAIYEYMAVVYYWARGWL